MKRSMLGLATLLLLLGGSATAKADLAYDNGPISGAINAWTINSGYSVSDSFTITGPTTLTGAQVGLWASSSDVPTGLSWSIGTAAFGSDLGSGTSALTDSFQYVNSFNFDIYKSSFSLTATLAAGTYWLTLQGGSTSGGNPLYWDENDGKSSAVDSSKGAIGSESFQLYGAVPEPASATMLGLGVVGLVGYARRRRKPAVS